MLSGRAQLPGPPPSQACFKVGAGRVQACRAPLPLPVQPHKSKPTVVGLVSQRLHAVHSGLQVERKHVHECEPSKLQPAHYIQLITYSIAEPSLHDQPTSANSPWPLPPRHAALRPLGPPPPPPRPQTPSLAPPAGAQAGQDTGHTQ